MKDDKFIMMNMNDERSKKIAEILGNKTCKKILDYLSEKNDASEKDISDALNIPINTAEYNLKKLIEAGLVEKTKNFFWSAKGKKIPLYRLARKHIVISPSSKPSLTSLKLILPVVATLFMAFILITLALQPHETPGTPDSKIKQFNSLSELKDFLKENQMQGYILT